MRILCLDFDGVCHQYDSPWTDEKTISDGPVKGLFSFLEEASDFFEVVIFSSRSKTPEGIAAMKTWFEHHLKLAGHKLGPDWYLRMKFAKEKPPAFLTLDDRCLCFEGTWPDVQSLRKFVPWNKRSKT